MSITIEGHAAPAGFVDELLERAAANPEAYGLSSQYLPGHAVGDTNFTWEEVAAVVDHEGVADGVVDHRDLDAFVDHARTSRGEFQRLVLSMGHGLAGRSSAGRVSASLVEDAEIATEGRCARLERAWHLFGNSYVNGEIGSLLPAVVAGGSYLATGCLFE